MVIPLPPKYRRRAPKNRTTAAPPPPGPLALVSATFDPAPVVILTFDRAIDISAMDVSKVFVSDSGVGFVYQGWQSPEQLDETTVLVQLNGISEDPPPGSHLTAEAGNGIVASEGGSAWSGVNDLELPFP